MNSITFYQFANYFYKTTLFGVLPLEIKGFHQK